MTTSAPHAGTVHEPHGGWARWTSRALSAFPVVLMVFSATMKLTHAPGFIEQWVGKLGWPESALVGVGLLELACVALYVIPRTAVLGAVLMTGYLGGAVASHLRVGDPALVVPLALGILAWAGLYLREGRLRTLLPLR